MSRFTRSLIVAAAALALPVAVTRAADAPQTYLVPVSASAEPMTTGTFEPTWESLEQFETPEWFRDAKFGIWAHWGPQCEPEDGDWYARDMYNENNGKYRTHVRKYGHPSKVGFKDVINEFKAENWDPDQLMALYKRAGAQYFFAMANHHDNFDMYDSKYQPWNSVNLGPKKDIMAGWVKAARANGLKFGVSIHASHAYTWYETAQGADKKGELAGVPYDGKITKEQGKGTWWEGYDPQDLYEQRHTPGRSLSATVRVWNWDVKAGGSIPDTAYVDKFYNRTIDLMNKYQPDMLYFDDTALPLWPISDAGLKIAAHLYNDSMKRNGGRQEAVVFGKVLNEQQRKAMVWDIERGHSNRIEPLPWQTDTCIGDWHYNRSRFDRHNYKSTKMVVHSLVDIVSKNGNLLLNVPVRGDGTIDADEVKVVEGIAKWMDVNKQAIYGTRPWKTFGEGPASATMAEIKEQGFNEGKGKPFEADDVRFTAKGDTLYMTALGWPTKPLAIKSLGKGAKLLDREIANIEMLGSDEKITWTAGDEAVTIEPSKAKPCEDAFVYKITLAPAAQ